VATFVLAIGALLVVRIPQPPVTEEGRQGQGNLLREAAYGFQYIFKRPSLLGLQLVFLRDSATSEKGRCSVLFWHCARPQAGLLARPVDQNAIINDNTKASIAASRFSFDLAPSECTVVPQALVLVDVRRRSSASAGSRAARRPGSGGNSTSEKSPIVCRRTTRTLSCV